jgi:hypothetical protein
MLATMLLATSLMWMVAAAAGESSDETWVSTEKASARLIAQAPPTPPPYIGQPAPNARTAYDLYYREQALTRERFDLQRQMYPNAAPPALTAAGAVLLGMGVLVGSFGMHMWYNFGTTWSSQTAFWGGISGIVGGIVMIILGRVISGQIDHHNRYVNQRLDEVNREIEAIEATRRPPETQDGEQAPQPVYPYQQQPVPVP